MPLVRYALERGPEHVAFVYDGVLLLNLSLALYPDVKLWQVRVILFIRSCADNVSSLQHVVPLHRTRIDERGTGALVHNSQHCGKPVAPPMSRL
jgi:hypothetical protein